MHRRVLIIVLAFCAVPVYSEPVHKIDRVVIVKVDGLPQRLLEQYAKSENGSIPHLVNIERIFGRQGAWFENFYVRGLSISAPSWSMLDTGRSPEIRGNVQYDRYTLRPWDYLNPFPFYLGYALSKRVDMLGVELLDEQGIRLLIDRFPMDQRYQSPQLLQRGIRWQTFGSSVTNPFKRGPRDIFDEWQTGFSISKSLNDVIEREIMAALKNPGIRYIDFFTAEYDHTAHLTADPVVTQHLLEDLDALIGRLWRGIEASPLAATTALILISDHGMNSAPNIFSQGFNLVDWFASAAGGGHHVLTNRHPLTEFKLKGLNPFVNEVITPSHDATYLKANPVEYPTVMLDLDGNERASIALRENAFNQLQILLDQIFIKRINGRIRTAAVRAVFEIIARNRSRWERQLAQQDEYAATRKAWIEQAEKLAARSPKKWTTAQRETGTDKDARRVIERWDRWRAEDRADSEYLAAMRRLLALHDADLDTTKLKIQDVIPRKSFGDVNQVRDLSRYTVGPAEKGLVMDANGLLNFEKSFASVDYFAALEALSVRNNVQQEVASRPVDFIAMALPIEELSIQEKIDGAIWLRKSRERQALILTRHTPDLELRYLPIADLTQDATGIQWRDCTWEAGYPLEIFEDPALNVVSKEWLKDWHSERSWFNAVHLTRHSNGIIGLAEQMLLPLSGTSDMKLRRERLRPDLLVIANDHWNFNVRGFNPGGNHGSFLRAATHSVFMMAGGADTGLPRGKRIATAYDSLSFLPTILKLMNMEDADLPGPLIEELLDNNPAR